mgnify:CR=1 FL=1|nr:MAG TPA: hypothetical protein [Caudoviricetes sp.]
MKPKKFLKGCLIAVIAFFAFIFVLGAIFSSTDNATSPKVEAQHKSVGVIQNDGSILVDSLYVIYAGPNGIGVTMPKIVQPPYFVLNFKEPTQVFEEQSLESADLEKSFSYALSGNMEEDKGKYTYWSPSHHILRTCLVESITSKDAIYAQIQGDYPFSVVMTNFGRDITEYIESIDLHLNLDGKDKAYTFYPSDGETYNKIVSGLLHEDIQ